MNEEQEKKEYYIFSDESGNKMLEDGYYVVSWIFINPVEYTKLTTSIKLYKEKNGNKELKFNKNIKYDFLENIDFKIFITVTSNKYFHNRGFKLLSEMNYLKLNNEKIFSINKSRFDFKNKIDNTIKNSIFLYLFEFYHIDNMIDFTKSKNINILDIVKDTPQYTDSEYKKVFKKALDDNNVNYKLTLIKKSEDYPGVELSDIVAGAFRYSLENNKKFIFKNKLKGGKVVMKDKEDLNYINLKSNIDNILE